jgi:hypothetical protein
MLLIDRDLRSMARFVCDVALPWFKYNGYSFSENITYDWMAHIYYGTLASTKIPSCTFPSVDFIQSGQCWDDHVYVTSMIYGPWLTLFFH